MRPYASTCSASETPRIAAVIVTRNRLALLKECLAAVRAQTRALDEIIVIDNASDDGTAQWLDEQGDLTVIHQGNLGGAGGFYRGVKAGVTNGHDWLWCMDDDTIPHQDALEKLCATPQFGDARTGYLGSLVVWTDGAPHKMNMWLDVPGGARNVGWFRSVLNDKCVPSVTSSFVSILISSRAVEHVGLPIPEMFIWADDSEFTYRISRQFRCYHVLDSVVVHKTASNSDGAAQSVAPADYWKLRYGLRNDVFFRRSQRDNPLRALHVAMLLARQSLWLLRHRAPLFLLRSLWSGLFFSPRIERIKRPAR